LTPYQHKTQQHKQPKGEKEETLRKKKRPDRKKKAKGQRQVVVMQNVSSETHTHKLVSFDVCVCLVHVFSVRLKKALMESLNIDTS